jgi:hypothetical protein
VGNQFIAVTKKLSVSLCRFRAASWNPIEEGQRPRKKTPFHTTFERPRLPLSAMVEFGTFEYWR